MPAPVTKETRLASLYARLAGVHLPFVKPAKKQSTGDHNAALMVVFGHALVDLAGHETEYLHKAFKLAELDPRHTFFSYAVRGSLLRKTGDFVLIESREPRKEEIEAFRPFLLEEIAIIKPKCVLCVGGTSIKTLMGDPHFSIVKMAGAEIDAPGVDCPVIATLSFSYVVKTGGVRSPSHRQFLSDLRHAKQLSEGEHEI